MRFVTLSYLPRIGVCFIAGAVGMFGLAGKVKAALPVELGQAEVEVNCAGDIESRTSTETIVTLACDRMVGDTNTAAALAEAYLDTPEVFVETFTSGPVTSIATSIITANIRVNQIVSPPVPTSIVDVGWFKSGEVVFTGASFGTVRASIDGPMHSDTTLALGPPNFENQRISIDLEPDEVYTVTLRAACQSASGGHCVAVLDPEVFLDQDAFDVRMGASTYPLADFYALEISANIGPRQVPALSVPAKLLVTLVLLVMGVAILSPARRRATRAW